MDGDTIIKQRIGYILIAGLFVVALVIGITKFQKKTEDKEVFSRDEFNKKWKEVEELLSKQPYIEDKVSYAFITEREPFESPVISGIFGDDLTQMGNTEIGLPAIKLQGMVWNSIRPQVIIDNKVYDINDEIEDSEIKIKGVEKDGVHLIYKEKEFIVKPK